MEKSKARFKRSVEVDDFEAKLSTGPYNDKPVSYTIWGTLFADGTLRLQVGDMGSARALKFHLAHEPDIILQPSEIKEPGKEY